MVKIGMTRRLDPYARVVELGDASVPFRFDVHAMVFHEDAVTLETHLHQALADRKVNRMNPRREFFYATPVEVRDILAKVAGAHLVEYREQPEAPEWHQSGAIARHTQVAADAVVDALEALNDATAEDLFGDLGEDETLAPDLDPSVDELDAIEETTLADEPTGAFPSVDPRNGGSPSPAHVPLTDPDPEGPATSPGESLAPSSSQPDLVAPADWYPDPHGVKRLRYWDGQRWTEHTAD